MWIQSHFTNELCEIAHFFSRYFKSDGVKSYATIILNGRLLFHLPLKKSGKCIG